MTRNSSLIIIAIDGGAASGKSSTSKILAERFNLLHVDTGSFYRHITHELLRRGVPPTNLAALTSALAELNFTTQLQGRSAQLMIDGQPADHEIRGQTVNDHVSHYAAIPAVRQKLLSYQRGQVAVAQQHGFRGLVMEGRDIGSVIFPAADYRFFLHADPIERAKRRAREGQLDSIAERDRLDSSRKASPLVSPTGAIDIDSTFLTLEQVVEKMAALMDTKLS
ncbi:MAG: (d)CMP kinase [Opitutaceae bacterium]|jgi:cytidylate kinase|nr:(d)CMP kinase [Opitutaceae bacterium]NBR59369.1 (d)CMP kinase [Opitutaceae bacterium]